jgi:hypothetical protein
MDAHTLNAWTRFALQKGGIGSCTALIDNPATDQEDLMFMTGEKIIVLRRLDDDETGGGKRRSAAAPSTSDADAWFLVSCIHQPFLPSQTHPTSLLLTGLLRRSRRTLQRRPRPIPRKAQETGIDAPKRDKQRARIDDPTHVEIRSGKHACVASTSRHAFCGHLFGWRGGC